MAYKAFQALLPSIASDTHVKCLEGKHFCQQAFSNIRSLKASKWNILTFSGLLFMCRAGSMLETKRRGYFFSQKEKGNPNCAHSCIFQIASCQVKTQSSLLSWSWDFRVYQYNLFFYVLFARNHRWQSMWQVNCIHSFWLHLSVSLLEWLPQYFHRSELKGWRRQTAKGKITKQQKWYCKLIQ